MSEIAERIENYLMRLFPLCRSITGEPNRQTLRILQEITPLTIHEVPSGTKVYDWTIPDEWVIRDAWIADASGRRIVDFQACNLHVVSYSEPVNAMMDWTELKSHIHYHPHIPTAIPYRTSYYKRDWGFCVTHAQYVELEQHHGLLTVVIDSELKPGSLSYGEVLIPGYSPKEILLSCYICHPSMANDSLSGVLLTAFLARYIARLKERHWSYRIVFVPETIGAIAYCSRNESAMKAIDIGLVITTVGGPGRFGYKQTWQADHWLNAVIETVLNETEQEYNVYPFDIHGSDERQYSSQAFRINISTICKDRYYEYVEYHTSLDNLDFVNGTQIAESYSLYQRLIKRIEGLEIFKNTLPNCEVMLSKHNLYPLIGGAISHRTDSRSEMDIILWLLFLCDGRTPIKIIAERLELDFKFVEQITKRLVNANILKKI